MKKLLLLLLLIGCGGDSIPPETEGKIVGIEFEANEIEKEFPKAKPRTDKIKVLAVGTREDVATLTKRVEELEEKPNWFDEWASKICFGLGVIIILIGIYAPGHSHSTAGLFFGTVGFAGAYYGEEIAFYGAIGVIIYQLIQLGLLYQTKKNKKEMENYYEEL